MTAPVSQSITDDALWELRKQPKDQIDSHEYSLWFAGEPVVLANSMPGVADVLQSMVDALNSHAALRAKVDELTAALRHVRNCPDNCDECHEIARKALALNSQHSGSGGVHFPGRDPTVGEII